MHTKRGKDIRPKPKDRMNKNHMTEYLYQGVKKKENQVTEMVLHDRKYVYIEEMYSIYSVPWIRSTGPAQT